MVCARGHAGIHEPGGRLSAAPGCCARLVEKTHLAGPIAVRSTPASLAGCSLVLLLQDLQNELMQGTRPVVPLGRGDTSGSVAPTGGAGWTQEGLYGGTRSQHA